MIEESCLDPRTEPQQPKPSENYGWACLAKQPTEITSQRKALEIHVRVYRLSATEPVVSQLELLLWASYSTSCLWSSIHPKKQVPLLEPNLILLQVLQGDVLKRYIYIYMWWYEKSHQIALQYFWQNRCWPELSFSANNYWHLYFKNTYILPKLCGNVFNKAVL